MTPFGGGYVYFDEVTAIRDVRLVLSQSPECTVTAPVQWPAGVNRFSGFVTPPAAPAQRRDWYRQFERSARHRRR